MISVNVEKYDFTDLREDADKKLVLIIYDIIDNKRRSKMVKLLESYGVRVQKSAFEILINRTQYLEIIKGIKNIITNEDNVRIYRLNSSNEVLLFGESYSVYEEEVIIV